MNKEKLLPSITLGSICLVVAALLAVVNLITGPRIEQNKLDKANEALVEVLPEGSGFKQMELTDSYPAVITAAYSADGGYVFEATVKGFDTGLVIMIGIDGDGRIAGVKHIASKETYGLEGELNGAYIGDTSDSLELIIASGATPGSKTSHAYYEAVKAALDAFTVANGGTVDLRTPEEILRDELRAALGDESAEFDPWFAYADVGADKVYLERGGEAIVLSIDGRYIAVEGGEVVTEGIDEASASAAVAAARDYLLVTGEGLTEAEMPEGVDASVAHSVTKIWSAPRGGYVFELRAAGYGILGGNKWHPASGEYITIKLAIDAQGRIISTLTVYENESDGIGDACADPEYYEQYNGKDGASVDEVPKISGATTTSDGYKKAVKNAFAVFELLSGGEENE